MDGNRIDYRLGCRMPIEQWLWLNRTGIFQRPELREYACVFPPVDLMHNVSGLQDVRDFAKHGTDLFAAVSEASPRPLTEYGHILDFGCGSERSQSAASYRIRPHSGLRLRQRTPGPAFQ